MRYLFLFLFAAGCGPVDTVAKSTPFAIDDFTRLDVFSVRGTVTISTSDSPTVDASLNYKGEVQPEVETRLAGETLLVSTNCPEEARRCSVDLDIKVPEGADVDIVSLEGDVTLTGIGGVVDVRVEEGNVAATSVSGNTRLDVPLGDVDLTAVTGRLDVNAPEGLIRGSALGSPTFDAVGDFNPIEVEFASQPDIVRVTSAKGDLTLRVPDGTYDVSTTTRKGQIFVTGITDTVGAGSVVLVTTTTGDITVQGL